MKMTYDRSKPLTKKNVIEFLRSLDIEVHTNTKARGNNGLYQRNRIDVARGLDEEKAISVLVHEFAHHIHSKIDNDFVRNGGSLECIFKVVNCEEIQKELVELTNLFDKNSKMNIFLKAKEEVSHQIKGMQKVIQNEYPKFQRSKKFEEFEKYIKNSDAKYLVKYDAVRLTAGFFFKKERILTVKNLEQDFPDMPKAFQLYIRLCSKQRKQAKITRRLNKMNKYFEKPTELFARFVQYYFCNSSEVSQIAPITTQRFNELLNSGYYKELKDFFEIFK